ncbi:hypothetical protein AAF712_007351 [Marasmius tenuissimus]|uniref:Uncharacterized protein n=1 Tax=Marasmius tenuissimus TaxID=585030 RepID=A0ABR2ZWK4_9AGAR
MPTATLFDSLTCPALHNLTTVTHVPPMEHIIRFLQRSSCRLEMFMLLFADPDGLVSLLQIPEVQSLRHLHVSGPFSLAPPHAHGVTNAVLNALRWEPSTSAGNTSRNGVLLPRLTGLSLFGAKQWSDSVLVGMLTSRRNVDETLSRSTSPLDMVRFERINATDSLEVEVVFEDEDALKQMEALVEAGLQVNSSTGSVSLSLA